MVSPLWTAARTPLGLATLVRRKRHRGREGSAVCHSESGARSIGVMRVVIAGGHGKIALILERLLTQRGDSVAAFIRNADHAADLQAAGAQPVVLDLEDAAVDDLVP